MFSAKAIILGIIIVATVTYIVKRILAPVKCHISVIKPLHIDIEPIRVDPIETDSLVTTKEYIEKDDREKAQEWAVEERQRLREAHAIKEE